MTTSTVNSIIIDDKLMTSSSSHIQLELELARLECQKSEITNRARQQEYTRRIRLLECQLSDHQQEIAVRLLPKLQL